MNHFVKLFGGGRMLPSMTDVGARNITFVRHWLAMEGLKISAEDLGSTVPRRVIYTPQNGKVMVKHLRTMESRVIATREQDYLSTFGKKAAADTNDIELFD
jgi:chemotaxis protein CheD